MVKAYAAFNAKEPLKIYEYASKPLKQNQVRIKVLSCGVCHSDISAIDNSWGKSSYPLVAGHEVIGKIIEIGSSTNQHELGDIVGLGWHSGYCNNCEQCEAGDHNFCSQTKNNL